MNDLDRQDHTDALGRRAAAALRADVERRHSAGGADGVDAALDRVQHGTGATLVSLTPDASPTRRVPSAWMGAAAAAVVVVIGTGAFLITRDDADSKVVPADTSAPSPEDTTDGTTNDTDASPATTAAADSTPATTLPDGTAPATTAPAEPESTTPALPATEVDALAGLVPPAPLDPFEIPTLLPPTPVADPSLVRRTGFSTPVDTVNRLHQTWASADGRIITITTEVGRVIERFGEVEVEGDVWPWDDAAVVGSMSEGFAELVLRDPSGEMSLWAAGFTDDELVSIARELTLTASGWQLGRSAPAELTLLHQGWNRTEFATRMLQWDDAGRLGELLVTSGNPDTIRSAFIPGGAATIVDSIDGAPALVSELPNGSAISWSPAPDVVVRIGISGSTDEVIELARSMTVVDIATWDAAGIADTSPADGCNSYFFC